MFPESYCEKLEMRLFILGKFKDIVLPSDVHAFGIKYKASWSGGVFFLHVLVRLVLFRCWHVT